MKKIKSIIIITLTLLLGMWLGGMFFSSDSHEGHNHSENQTENVETNKIWTCSMHPQIRQPSPGLCPICGMDLIPLEDDDLEGGEPNEIKMSSAAIQLANIQTMVITKNSAKKELRLNGKVEADERYVFTQTSHVGGRVEELLVNYTGEYVKKGQVIAYIYSPALVTAQEELFEAMKVREMQPELYEATIKKLKNWKLSDWQIEELIKSKETVEHFPILSDLDGVVVSKLVNLGEHLMAGSPLFKVADLSKLWVLFDIYERDMALVKTGNKIEFSVHSLPGETFEGNISFIEPVINPKTRVAKARIDFDNRGYKLKPEMFVTGELEGVISRDLDMLTIPKSAVMWTGERSIVYVKTRSDNGISFIAREVILGVSLGSEYVLKSGVEEGEEVASYGTFSIDAAAQLVGKHSMMNKGAGGKKSSEDLESIFEHNDDIRREEKIEVVRVIRKYLLLKESLVNDREDYSNLANDIIKQILATKESNLRGDNYKYWDKKKESIIGGLKLIRGSEDIEKARKFFEGVSKEMAFLSKYFGPFREDLYLQYCPMAGDSGAYWLSESEEIKNPYFGKSMLGCGEVKMVIK